MQALLEVKQIEKTFNGTIKALQGADLTVNKGEIHALLGENAAGKSTLMNILFGSLPADAGEIWLNGKKAEINCPADAIRLGIGMVHQHYKLVPGFTVLENVILGGEQAYVSRLTKRIEWEKAGKKVQELLDSLSVDLKLHDVTGGLPIGLQCKVEIIKCLFRGASLLILDEPTTVLAPTEVAQFFTFLRSLRERGITMIYISHRLKEIFELTDSITVLRKGRTVATRKTADASMEEITRLMVGKDVEKLSLTYPVNKSILDKPILELKEVSAKGSRVRLSSISFSVRVGEILGIAGIGGNGQMELADCLIGIQKISGGRIFFKQKEITSMDTASRRRDGMHYVPDDRIHKGLAMGLSILENSIVGYEREQPIRKRKFGLNWREAEKFSRAIISDYHVEGLSDIRQPISSLSGGNMQKILMGREMCTEPLLLILSQPTSGIDFHAQKQIHEKILDLQKKGTTFVIISEDLDELMNLSDRIIVLYRGRIVHEFIEKEDFDEKQIGYYMMGVGCSENG